VPRSSGAVKDDIRASRSAEGRSGGRSSGHSLEKVTVNLTRRSAEALDRIVESTGDTKTDGINKALQVFAYLQEQLDNGASIYLKDADSEQADRLKIF
jgi:hypothetical protein